MIVDDGLEGGIYHLRLRHGFEIGILVNDDDKLLGKRVQVGEDILKTWKRCCKGQYLQARELLRQPVDIVPHRPSQAFIVDIGLLLLFKRFLDQCGLSYPALSIEQGCGPLFLERFQEQLELPASSDKHDLTSSMLNLFSMKIHSIKSYYKICSLSRTMCLNDMDQRHNYYLTFIK